MIKIELIFTNNEAISLFRDLGLEVKISDMSIGFENPHGDGGHNEILPIWTVTNPKNGKLEKLEELFKKYLKIKKEELFLNAGRLEIYNLFKK